MSNPRKVVLFGGQGSQHLFSSQNASTAAADARSSSAAAILLSRCHAVFLEDLRIIGSAESKVFGDYSKFFVSPESLLCPDATFHDSPILQSTTIALHQLSDTFPTQLSLPRPMEIFGIRSKKQPAFVLEFSQQLLSVRQALWKIT